MLTKLYYPVAQWRKLPPALGLSLGGLLGLLLAIFVVGKRAEQQTGRLFEEYGDALATLTAQRAIDSVVSGDLVSLHAVLQDVIAQERAVFASAHGVDGALLVQAGESFQSGPTAQFTATISLQEDRAGRISVTLDRDFEGDQLLRWSMIGTGALLALMAVLALYESYGHFWQLRTKPLARRAAQNTDPSPAYHEADPEVDELDSDFDDDLIASGDDHAARCVLTLSMLNRGTLEQTISGDLFEGVIAEFEHKLKHVVSLYGGKITRYADIESDCTVEFYADERTSEALFQSICAAYLLNALLRDSKFRLRLNAYASVNGNVAPIKREGIFCENVETSEFLSVRLDVEEIEANVFWVRGLKAPFSALVEQQLQHVKAAS